MNYEVKDPNKILHKDLNGNSFKENFALLKVSEYIAWLIISYIFKYDDLTFTLLSQEFRYCQYCIKESL